MKKLVTVFAIAVVFCSVFTWGNLVEANGRQVNLDLSIQERIHPVGEIDMEVTVEVVDGRSFWLKTRYRRKNLETGFLDSWYEIPKWNYVKPTDEEHYRETFFFTTALDHPGLYIVEFYGMYYNDDGETIIIEGDTEEIIVIPKDSPKPTAVIEDTAAVCFYNEVYVHCFASGYGFDGKKFQASLVFQYKGKDITNPITIGLVNGKGTHIKFNVPLIMFLGYESRMIDVRIYLTFEDGSKLNFWGMTKGTFQVPEHIHVP